MTYFETDTGTQDLRPPQPGTLAGSFLKANHTRCDFDKVFFNNNTNNNNNNNNTPVTSKYWVGIRRGA